MDIFTQKWVLVTFLEPAKEGTEFFYKDWPLHVTIAPVFAADIEGTGMLEKLAALLSAQEPVEVIAEEDVQWGDLTVVQLQKTPKIMALHQDVIDVLRNCGATFNDPQYIEQNYLPHSTVQHHGRIHEGDVVKINEITLVDMFSRGDGHQRKVLQTVTFSKE